ncbi:MAG: hypothetical protein P8X64_04455 [Anaerolineales bacterium]|jgi:hypothetical protein
MLPYIVLAAAVIYFIIQGLGWLDDLADRQERHGRSGPWQEITPPEQTQDKRLEVFRQFLESDDGEADGQ